MIKRRSNKAQKQGGAQTTLQNLHHGLCDDDSLVEPTTDNHRGDGAVLGWSHARTQEDAREIKDRRGDERGQHLRRQLGLPHGRVCGWQNSEAAQER